MTKRNTDGLRAAAKRKADAAQDRVDKAILQMRKTHEPINISTVASKAGVSRTYLQKHPEFRERIRTLGRVTTAGISEASDTGDRAIIAALTNEITAIEARHNLEVATLRQEVRRLELALVQAKARPLPSRS